VADELNPPIRPTSGQDSATARESKEDALRVLRALTAASKPPQRSLPARKTLMIITIVVPIVLVVGLIIGASYLEHLADSESGTGPVKPFTATEANLNTALTAAVRFAANHQHSLLGVTAPTGLAASVTALTFSSVSGSPSVVAVDMPSPGALVMTSLRPSPPACFGVLDVVAAQAAAVFSGYGVTQQAGTYYFEAPATDGLCNAVAVEPPAPGNYVSVTGFPTESLP
jgi:hypothetical protein